MPERPLDLELEESTNRWMLWGVGLMAVMVLAFPLYRFTEPTNRQAAYDDQLQSLAEQGETLYSFNCSSCHGLAGEGGVGPALNAKQFFEAATQEQTEILIAVGVPGSAMSAYSLDFGGPLTSEQIRAIGVFLESWAEDAPDRPDWRDGS